MTVFSQVEQVISSKKRVNSERVNRQQSIILCKNEISCHVYILTSVLPEFLFVLNFGFELYNMHFYPDAW